MADTKKLNFKSGRESLDLYDQFLAKSSLDRLQKILARYELFRMAQDVPGHIVECGVYKGSGIYLFAKLQKLFSPHNDRRIIGFDFFEVRKKTKTRFAQDKQLLANHDKGWFSRKIIFENLANLGIDNVELIAGDVAKTTCEFVKKNIGARIALLYLDVDVYEATLACLKNLYPLVSPGGIVVFDEYGYDEVGESKAVDEYFAKQKINKVFLRINLKTLPWANTPTAYIVK